MVGPVPRQTDSDRGHEGQNGPEGRRDEFRMGSYPRQLVPLLDQAERVSTRSGGCDLRRKDVGVQEGSRYSGNAQLNW